MLITYSFKRLFICIKYIFLQKYLLNMSNLNKKGFRTSVTESLKSRIPHEPFSRIAKFDKPTESKPKIEFFKFLKKTKPPHLNVAGIYLSILIEFDIPTYNIKKAIETFQASIIIGNVEEVKKIAKCRIYNYLCNRIEQVVNENKLKLSDIAYSEIVFK